jgi:hypothetical protein
MAASTAALSGNFRVEPDLVHHVPLWGGERGQVQFVELAVLSKWTCPRSASINRRRESRINLKTPVFARIDGFESAGIFVLSELEFIEPVLFVRTNEKAKTFFADAIIAAARDKTAHLTEVVRVAIDRTTVRRDILERFKSCLVS